MINTEDRTASGGMGLLILGDGRNGIKEKFESVQKLIPKTQ